MEEKNYVKLKIAYIFDQNFNILFVLLLWILEYKTAFWIFLVLTILDSFAKSWTLNKLKN